MSRLSVAFFRTGLSLLALALVSPLPAAQAQDCGSWSRSVLCEIELQASKDRGQWELFDPDRPQQIAPGQRMEIELRGWDQYRREFPRERLTLSFDSYDCNSMLRIEDRGRGLIEIESTATSGRCRLDLWVPGNLNLEWRVELEIAAAARTGYSRQEAEFLVRALYLAILGREADAGSISAAVTEIQRGNLQSQVYSMVRSQEFSSRTQGMSPNDILESFYSALLGRPLDTGGLRTYLTDIQRGNYSDSVLKIVRSGEFEQRLQRESR